MAINEISWDNLMTIKRTKTLTIIGMIILNAHAQMHTVWQNCMNQLSRKSLVFGSVATTMYYGINYWRNKKSVWQEMADHCKVHIAQAKQQALHDILKKYNDSVSSTHRYTIRQLTLTQEWPINYDSFKDIPWANRLSFDLQSNTTHTLALYENCAPVGIITYSHARHAADIRTVGIKESHQKKGLGTLLMSYVMRMIANKGYQRITLTAIAQDPKNLPDLCRLYEKHLGFEITDPDETAPRFAFNNKMVCISSAN